jgi:hypothetical protein
MCTSLVAAVVIFALREPRQRARTAVNLAPRWSSWRAGRVMLIGVLRGDRSR